MSKIEDFRTYELLNSSWSVQGCSKAGYASGYFVHGPNFVVEAGFPTLRSPKAVFITHRHTDHAANLPMVVHSRSSKKRGQKHLKGRPVYMPASMVPMVRHLCASFAYLSDGELPEEPFGRMGMHEMPVEVGEMLAVPGMPKLHVEVLRCYHRCETVGYGFSERRRRLHPRFAGLPTSELRALKLGGTEITQEVLIPQVVFFGDSTPDALLEHDEWLRYPNVFFECTACWRRGDEDAQRQEALDRRARGHSHIHELQGIIEKHREGRRWFLQHTSCGCSPKELRAVLASLSADVVIVEEDLG
eukprot:gnl/Dysnectes_brevis/2781_a3389_712.p1 GENE.gnl/Dysnectes_brevis/2781_a3389_712~~gnl/Dysnectes_brevis/2781_a3389_712.p1  ORF type:complete len:302 (+),score=98.12 gnl/Dysnectes_brevis/2781_a3389_712:62-967(+)